MTVDEYLAALPPDRTAELKRVRAAIRRALPKGYEEAVAGKVIAYQVPLAVYPDTYNGHPLWLAALAAPKTTLTLHLMPDAITEVVASMPVEKWVGNHAFRSP
ncbi:MAG TPA: hypothetical protein VGQ37_02475 [Vicinamibacterales bacterium]|nr:hypothetical protein [Vicinamibacterales bacterium]